MKHFFLLLLAGVVLASCYDCGPQEELSFDLSITSSTLDTMPPIRRVYSKAGIDTIDLSDKINSQYPSQSISLILPLTLHENQTTYFFESENRLDSLTMFYERKFYYDNHCGFVADVSTSKNPPRAVGSFSKVQIFSTPYVGGEHANTFPGGIFVDVTL